MSRRASLIVLLAILASTPTTAQVHHLDDAPWYTLTDSLSRRGSELRYDQFRDSETGWRTDRLGLTLHMGLGERAVFYVQADYFRFDTATLPVLERWPDLAQPDDNGELDTEWPYETIINGFGRPELGLLFPMLGGDMAFVAGFPVGSDELYPMSSASLPLRLDWRKVLDPPGALTGAVRVGVEYTADSGRDYLTSSAFPSGFRYGLELGLVPEPDRGVMLEWSARELAEGRHLRRLKATGLIPLGGRNALAVHATRDLGGKADRYATWTVGVAWRLVALPRETETGP